MQEHQKGALVYSLSTSEGGPLTELRVRVYLKLQSLLVSGFGTGSLGSVVIIVLLEMGDIYSLILAHPLSDLEGSAGS